MINVTSAVKVRDFGYALAFEVIAWSFMSAAVTINR
jgi:hypothetical protein